MSTSVSTRNKHLCRPRKSDASHRRRTKIWRRRLIALGMKEEAVNKLTPLQVRTLLKRPAEVAAAAKKG